MKILACYNLKGGVGKTTATVNLGFAAAAAGLRVLIWDLDPQAAATYSFRVKPRLKGGSERLLGKKRQLMDFVKATNYPGLDLAPADFSHRYLDRLLADGKKPPRRLQWLAHSVSDHYDLLLFDCMPSLSTVADNVFVAADALLVPLVPTPLSLRTWALLKKYLASRPEFNTRLLPFFSMVDRRKSMHREVVLRFPRDNPETLRTFIGYQSDVEKMGARRAPVQTYARRSAAARAFALLWDEISEKVDCRPRVPPEN